MSSIQARTTQLGQTHDYENPSSFSVQSTQEQLAEKKFPYALVKHSTDNADN